MSDTTTSTAPAPSPQPASWSAFAKTAFRIFFLYFFIQAVPLAWKFYQGLISINWLHIRFTDIFNIAHYAPRFSSGAQTYADWTIVAIIAIIGGTVWTFAEKKKTENYNQLYYWLRVLVRLPAVHCRYCIWIYQIFPAPGALSFAQ